MEDNARPAQKKWLVPALLAVVILLLAVVLIVVLSGRGGEPANDGPDEDIAAAGTPKIGYAEGVTVVEDPDALQKAVDEMYAKAAEGGVGLEYKNDAFSTDGTNFECYIANAASNKYDMYIQIFADDALTDELYLSQLLRPGTAFDKLELEHSLDAGDHRVYVAFTQVEEDLSTIHAQVMVTMDFHVNAE